MEVEEAKMQQVFATVAMDNKLTKKEVKEVFSQWGQYERDDRNLFGVVNAVTRAGQTLDNMSWVKFDGIGGKLMDTSESRWASILTRAASLDDKDLEKAYGVTA